jgi:tyrosinase
MATHAQEIAKTYNSATYTKAADNLRLPYFDWAAAPQQFPAIMSAPNVDIDTPTGLKSVKNPLYRFDFLSVPYPEEWFPTTPGSYDGFFALQPFTLRQPNANNQSRDNLIPPQFAEEGPILTAQIVCSPIY